MLSGDRFRRDNRRNLTEIFNYDNLGRLTAVSGPAPLTTSFANNGNITNKTSVGDYTYGSKPHAVTKVENPVGLIPSADQRLSYTSYNKADSIIQGNYIYTLQYGCNDQRTVSKLFRNDTLQKTVYYIGAYEKEVIPGSYDKYINYIYGGDGLAAICVISSGTTMYYVHKDHLGSIDKITNASKAVIQKTSFDAWGRRRNPDNWTYTNIPATTFSRGYTGHEHLDQFDLINMNGRMYDPILGRFLSADKIIQNPNFSQSYNRYSYCFNNPLLYTDPSGWQLAPIDQYWNLGKLRTNQTRMSGYDEIGNGQGWGGNDANYYFEGPRLTTIELLARLLTDTPEDDKHHTYVNIAGEWIEVAAGQGGDQSWILGPRGADWGSSMENIVRWAYEMEYRSTAKTNRTGLPPTPVRIFVALFPPTSVINAGKTIISGNDLFNRDANSFLERGVVAPLDLLFPFAPIKIQSTLLYMTTNRTMTLYDIYNETEPNE